MASKAIVSNVGEFCNDIPANTALNFRKVRSEIAALSKRLSAMKPTATATAKDRTLVIKGTKAAIEVVKIAAPDTLSHDISSIVVDNIRPGALLVINVPGVKTGVMNINTDALSGARALLHFPEATEVVIQKAAVMASIVAPRATLSGREGMVAGQVIVNKLEPLENGPSLFVAWKPLGEVCSDDDGHGGH